MDVSTEKTRRKRNCETKSDRVVENANGAARKAAEEAAAVVVVSVVAAAAVTATVAAAIVTTTATADIEVGAKVMTRKEEECCAHRAKEKVIKVREGFK